MANTRRLLSDATVTTALQTVNDAITSQLHDNGGKKPTVEALAGLFSAKKDLETLAARNGNGAPKVASDKPKKERKGRVSTDPPSGIPSEF